MTRNWHNPDRPTPAEFQAWVEGDLDGPDAARIEAWVRDNPDEAADATEGQCRLTGLFREHAPPEPSPDAWNNTLSRIKARTARRRSRWLGGLWIGLAGAAAVLICVVGTSLLWPGPKDTGPEKVLREEGENNDLPWIVATADEIDVVQLHPRDAGRLMIGQLLEPFEILSSDEVTLVSREPDEDGTMPELLLKPFPMVVARSDGDE